MLSTEQKITMAYGIMRMTLDEIVHLSPQDYRGDGNTLSDAMNLARKAVKAVDELMKEEVK